MRKIPKRGHAKQLQLVMTGFENLEAVFQNLKLYPNRFKPDEASTVAIPTNKQFQVINRYVLNKQVAAGSRCRRKMAETIHRYIYSRTVSIRKKLKSITIDRCETMVFLISIQFHIPE